VTYVVGDVADAIESPVYAIFAMQSAIEALGARQFGGDASSIRILHGQQPDDDRHPTIAWDGEWDLTLEVFTDMGVAFADCIIVIYLLMVGWFRSFTTPLVVMIVIPYSLLGVLPAHAGAGVFFTATSMIGFMAGAGIVVRNAIILVDFIDAELAAGRNVGEAAVNAGLVRFRPMLLTALAVVVGAGVILTDPIFQGLALALIAGSLASLLTAPVLVPLLYARLRRREPATTTAG
jgi:multidrug efflux pump subunit AcrB